MSGSCREAAGRDPVRAHVPPRRARRQGDGRDERVRPRDGARAVPHGRARRRVHPLAELLHPARRGDGARGTRHPPLGGAPGPDAARGRARPPGRLRGGRGAVPARAGTRVRPDPRALLALRRGRARPARDVGRAARADVPHPRAAQEHGGAVGGRGRARAADRRGVADHRRGRPHRRRQRGGARAPGLVLRRARRARRGHPVRRRHGVVPADGSRGGQGLARARARALADLRGATAADQGTRDLARRDGAAAGGHAAHHRRRSG